MLQNGVYRKKIYLFNSLTLLLLTFIYFVSFTSSKIHFMRWNFWEVIRFAILLRMCRLNVKPLLIQCYRFWFITCRKKWWRAMLINNIQLQCESEKYHHQYCEMIDWLIDLLQWTCVMYKKLWKLWFDLDVTVKRWQV